MSASPLVPERVSATSMSVARTGVGRRAVLSIAGEVDLDTAPRIADAVDDALEVGALEFWLDLSESEFMDSAGLHLLVETQLRLRLLNRRLAVICGAGPVRRLLEQAGAAGDLPLYHDRAAAHRAA